MRRHVERFRGRADVAIPADQFELNLVKIRYAQLLGFGLAIDRGRAQPSALHNARP